MYLKYLGRRGLRLLDPSACRARIRWGAFGQTLGHLLLLTPAVTGNTRHCTLLTPAVQKYDGCTKVILMGAQRLSCGSQMLSCGAQGFCGAKQLSRTDIARC